MSMVLQPVVHDDKARGWLAKLDLLFEPRPAKTVLARRTQRGPLAVQRPFYPEENVCHIYLLHPPGGVVGGDQLHITTQVKTGAHTVITTPGATKFYRSSGETAIQQQQLLVENDATLEWLPQETIYFPGAKAVMKTRIELSEHARFVGWESHCLGLPVNNQAFSSGDLQIQFEVMRDGVPVVLEKMRVDADQLLRPTGLRGHPVMSTLIATPADKTVLEITRTVLEDAQGELFSATLIDNCLLVRYLGESTAESRSVLTQVWNAIRPLVVNRPACPPRIWST